MILSVALTGRCNTAALKASASREAGATEHEGEDEGEGDEGCTTRSNFKTATTTFNILTKIRHDVKVFWELSVQWSGKLTQSIEPRHIRDKVACESSEMLIDDAAATSRWMYPLRGRTNSNSTNVPIGIHNPSWLAISRGDDVVLVAARSTSLSRVKDAQTYKRNLVPGRSDKGAKADNETSSE